MLSLPQPRQLAAVILLVWSTTAWAASVSKLESLGDDTFAITRTAKTGFDRDVDKFKHEAELDAAKYGTDHGKGIRILAATSDRPHFGLGYAWAKIVFKALDANDPALHEPVAPAPSPAAASSGVAPYTGAPAANILPTYAGDLYAEILKLDDLRKRGLLTDKEFEQQKKKLLKNSK